MWDFLLFTLSDKKAKLFEAEACDNIGSLDINVTDSGRPQITHRISINFHCRHSHAFTLLVLCVG